MDRSQGKDRSTVFWRFNRASSLSGSWQDSVPHELFGLRALVPHWLLAGGCLKFLAMWSSTGQLQHGSQLHWNKQVEREKEKSHSLL